MELKYIFRYEVIDCILLIEEIWSCCYCILIDEWGMKSWVLLFWFFLKFYEIVILLIFGLCKNLFNVDVMKLNIIVSYKKYVRIYSDLLFEENVIY